MTDSIATHFNYNNDSHHNDVPKDVVTASVHPTVTVIKDSAFYKCRSLVTISIPDQVTTIENNAFLGCTSLVSIIIPGQVTFIGNTAFYGCTSLVSIIISDQVTFIGNAAFYKCRSLVTIIMPDQLTTIENNAFHECTSLVSIIIPDQVTTIGNWAFYQCTALEAINIPDQVTTIGNTAFYQCTSLVSIIIPDQVTTIGCNTFYGCTSLVSIIMPDQVTTIGYNTFYGCTSLVSIIIPDQVTTIEHGAFFKCIALNQRQPNGKNYHANTDTWLRQRFNDLPLHQACYNNNTNTFITDKRNIHNLLQQHNTSMLTSTDAMAMTPLHVLCCNPTATLESIQILKAAQPPAALMRNVLHQTPLMLLLESKSKKYRAFHNEEGHLLPLVGLLEQGLDFDALEMIQSISGNNIFVSELQSNDETSGLLPFMYGASLENCRLDIVYDLAMKLPDLLIRMHQESTDNVVSKESKKRKHDSNDEYTSSSKK
jgi:hypothetical protein